MLNRTRSRAVTFPPANANPGADGAALPPRLLIVGPLPPPLGGVQLTIDMQLHSSLAREFELHVVDTSKRQLRWAVENPTWKTPLYFARDFLRLVRALVRLRPKVVLVHAAATFSLLRDWVFMATARIAGAKVICHYHGTLHTRFPSGNTRSGRFIGRMLMSAAHRVIVLSPSYRREMAKAWKRDDLVWAPNMADVALYRSVSANTPAPWLASGEKAVLFVGRLSAPKGIYDLFDAIPRVLERHPEAKFVLVGVAESDAMEPVIRAEAGRRGIASRIAFLGALEGSDKAAAFATSQMIVVPSWTEAFPLVIPEAMAAGIPVVATAVGAIPDFVKDEEDGFLIAPRDWKALADCICRLLDDERLRRRIGERVRERAPREFAIEVGCGKVLEVARDVLAKPPASRLSPDCRNRI
ncbi:MAG: glycosyltransferase family 4 protein [Prolixibacteraceae bacterium]|nr:glycosyltransferase family 4 protein [Burkholderiales bacterium]